MSRIGIMGGTFDPIHLGHLVLGEAAYQQFDLDEVWFMPCGHSYFKDSRKDKVSSTKDRLEMCRLAIADNPHFSVSDMEILREGNTYTADTLLQCHKEYPKDTFFFIVGADTICSMDTWYHPEIVFDHAIILAAMRENEEPTELVLKEADRLKKVYKADIRFMTSPIIGVSSTMIRAYTTKEQSTRYMIPEAVREYITSNGLYQEVPLG